MKTRNWSPDDRFTYLDLEMNLRYGTVTRVDGDLIYGRTDDNPKYEVFFHRYAYNIIQGEIKGKTERPV